MTAVEDVSALGRVAYAAGTAPDTRALMEEAGREVLRAFGADVIGLYLVNRDEHRLVTAYRSGALPAEEKAFEATPATASMSWQVASDGVARSWRVHDYPAAAQWLVPRCSVRTTSAVPMKVGSRVIGTLNLSFRQERLLPPDRLRLLEVMAAHFAQALEAQRATAQARETSAENAQLCEELRISATALASARAELDARARLSALGELSAVVAHELRNPLNVISNVVSLLLARAEHPDTEALARAAREELARMDALVADLLEFARPPELVREPTEVGPLLHEVAAALAAEPAGQAVAVRVEVDPALAAVDVDRRRLRQALLNLAHNGAQAMRQGGVLTLAARVEGNRLRLEVSDQGPGIPADVQARLFQPFVTTKPTGTGLGLVLVQRVAEQHGGEVAVVSELGRGTTFALLLPLGRAADYSKPPSPSP